MDGFRVVTCQSCNFVGEPFESDGFFFCSSCGEKNQDAFDNGAEEEEAFGTVGGIYLPSHQRRASTHSEAIDVPPISQYDPLSQSNLLSSLGLIEVKQENVDLSHSHFSPSTPVDFGGSNVPSSEDYHNEIRLRYVFGLQIMIELQCEALVKEFKGYGLVHVRCILPWHLLSKLGFVPLVIEFREIQKIIIHAVNTDQNLASMAQSPTPFLFFLSEDSSANDIDANSAVKIWKFQLSKYNLKTYNTGRMEDAKAGSDGIADAEENLGESEVREAHLAKSLFFIRIGDKEKALEHLKITETKIVAVGQKMDLVFYTLQLGFFDMDFDLISKSIDKAKSLFEEGGDWERKNRLKVYEGLYCMSTRNFEKAATLFLDSISTFTTYELFPYDTFIFYTVLTSIITLDRVSLKQKVVDAPEILTVIGKIPHLSEFLNSLYDCQYKSFFSAFAGLTEQIKLDRYLHSHFRYYMREIRTRHARSEKLHREGRLKVMLNSDGEIENQEDSDKETEDTEELLKPLKNVVPWLQEIFTWERPIHTLVVLAASLIITYMEWVGKRAAAFLVWVIVKMLEAREKKLNEQCNEIVVSRYDMASDQSMMDNIVSAQHGFYIHAKTVMVAIGGLAFLLAVIPFKFLLMGLIVQSFTMAFKTSKSSGTGNRRLKEWWDSILVVPIRVVDNVPNSQHAK
ncbi:unnamed protein product [Vicia faba]|uniref:26S proteasome regulatory subunit RPN7 n=1 Tax=Vicia faba TaxID=3906 RepID=A0AAV1A7F9_VICFA|nr:unnamed protein product [Vicia faba]